MGEEPFRGFVIKSLPLSTHRHILVTFTEKGGKRQGIFRISKYQPRAYLTPLTLLQFQLRGKQQQNLPAVIEPNLERHYFNFAGDYLGLTLLQHWANLVDSCQAEAQEDRRVFRLMDHCLSHLDSKLPNLLPLQNIYFELWLLHLAGIIPRPQGNTPKIKKPPTKSEQHHLEQHYHELDPFLLSRVFQLNIEDFAAISLQCETLAQTLALLGQMWVHFLGRIVNTHTWLQDRFKERGLL